MNVLYSTTILKILKPKHITIFHTCYSTTELLLSRAGDFQNLCVEVLRTSLLLRIITGE